MGRNRRQQRLRQRRTERSASNGAAPVASTGASSAGTPPRRTKPAWRHTLDQWGGMPMLGGAAVILVVLGVLIWQNLPEGVQISGADLLGEEVPMTGASHISDPLLMDIQPGLPPVGGPHFPQPLVTGIYDQAPEDGNVVHSLEHGMVWFSYNPELITPEDLEAVIDVAEEYSNDTIVAPRPDNEGALYALSWGRRLQIESPVDRDLLREFIETNRNRSPEPGVRGGISM
jgi:hypothetical protein